MRQSRGISLTNVRRDVGGKRRVDKRDKKSDKNGKIKIVGRKLAKILAVNRNKSGRKSSAKKKRKKYSFIVNCS